MKLLSKLFDFLCLTNSSTESADKIRIPVNVLNEAIERVVDGIEPKMRYSPGYKKILNNGVSTSLAYISNLVDTIPEPIFISQKNFFTDPQLKAYFATIANIHDVFSSNKELRDFFAAPENCNLDEACGLLCMNETEKTVLGMELHGDVISRDVMQTALNFSEHKILSPATCEAEVRKGIKQCIFDALITHALQEIMELKQQRQGLETQRSLLKSRLKTRKSQGDGLSKLLTSATEAELSVNIEQQIAENEKKLQKFPASWDAPQFYMEIINNILARPENFIGIKAKSFNITQLGIVASEKSSQSVNTIHFNEILIANVLKRVVAIVRYPRSEMLPRKKFNLKE
ncbi:MAG: hypothetical protein QNL62_14650 [Gammaproteobacteria bacterium]|nr:hypothetical protein [Gammaproteobacteria bacterium]